MNIKNKFIVSDSDKFGLALSGGGFRAALFHIGVLARLAELDLLRKVQVLSTVSGGSIIGAMYYLKIKQLLENKRSDGLTPSPDAYIKIINELEIEFLKGVQMNLRVRALLNPIKNAKMIVSDDYSRSDRMSELYDEIFYNPIFHSQSEEGFVHWLKDALSLIDSRNTFLKDLKIYPAGTTDKESFDIEKYNQLAEYKIPVLSINATTLNSGEHWIFTASSVGVAAKPDSIHPTPTLYPQLQFNDPNLSQKQKDKLNSLTLSDAVAASACVPALFAPLAIHDLYPQADKEVVIELVDGGVFDNQGLSTLFEKDCTHILCSDASGQLHYDRTPASGAGPVMLRANDIMMERIRCMVAHELGDYALRKQIHNNLAVDGRFWHLRNQFNGTKNFPAFSEPIDSSNEKDNGQIYLLSAIRTDLDAFTDIEANSLMYNGYCLCDYFVNQSEGLNNPPQNTWSFLNIRTEITNHSTNKLTFHLAVAGNMLFKAFRLMGKQGLIFGGLLIVLAVGIAWAGIYTSLIKYMEPFCNMFRSPGIVTNTIIFGLAGLVFMKKLPKQLQQPITDSLRILRTGNAWGLIYPVALIGGIGSIFAYLHLKIINPIFLKLGRITV